APHGSETQAAKRQSPPPLWGRVRVGVVGPQPLFPEGPIVSFLLLTEDDVRRLLTMDMALAAVADALRKQALQEAQNIPRSRCQTDHAMLHVLSAAAKTLGVLGYKAYTTTRKGAQFHVALYDGRSGALTAILQADYLGQVRTGAASGVATQHMARPD